MRAKLRSFDPVVRYGGDEFICALAGTDPDDAGRRFAEIQDELARDYDDAGISVGVVELGDGRDARRPDRPRRRRAVRGQGPPAALTARRGQCRPSRTSTTSWSSRSLE